MSLDIPSLDGHLAALEMREHGGDSRILFIAPNRLRELAVHATYSAGAVGWLAKPVSQAQLDEIWDQVLGPIPEAPGLEDIDELYPEDRIKPQPDEIQLPPLGGLPPLESLPPIAELPKIEPEVVETTRPKKRGRVLLILLVLIGIGCGAAYQQGYLDSWL